jgi:hypothetical protein
MSELLWWQSSEPLELLRRQWWAQPQRSARKGTCFFVLHSGTYARCCGHGRYKMQPLVSKLQLVWRKWPLTHAPLQL